ncbi:IS3 family transposase [Terasakiella sp. A23]|uniref:IS3 family transposase n=1 Tax=Terasakiella sp. FCG-A23 TaxID=3080561 RepID=UPI0029537A03|nr:IS3 family transposase [Terasakiella sp. A23]MDV7341853.1 IS3 family transposase [Terasakiella sp. A23]
MGNKENKRVKRTQRDYPLAFKLSVVEQIEKGEMTYKQAQNRYGIQGRSTALTWLRKHGKLDWSKPIHYRVAMPTSKETPAQKIKRLEKELEDEKLKNFIYGEMVDLVHREYGIDMPKKVLCRTLWLAKEKGQVKLATVCRLIGLSRQAVYQWKGRLEERERTLLPVRDMILYWRRFMPRIGTRKLYHLIKPQLETQGIKLGRDGLFRYLKQENLLVKPRRSYTKTTYSKHWLRKHPNLLKSQRVEDIEQVFVSDITYVQTDEGTHYLSLVTDACSRRIMGYEVSSEMKASDVVKALKMSVAQRITDTPTIHHSDRGLQYCSAEYQDVLSKNRIKPSMTDGYDCYQNALAERVNGILKHEFLLHQCKNLWELKTLVAQSVQVYNELRPHLSLGMKTPNQMHRKARCQKQRA